MKLRDRIRKYLGTDNAQAVMNRMDTCASAISKHALELERMRDEQTRLRALIVENFEQTKPASIEAIDAIFKETRDRLDVVMVCLDNFRDAMARR